MTGRKYLRSQLRLTDVKYLSDRRIRVTCGWESCFDIYPVGTMWQVVFGLYLYLFSFKTITAKNYLKLCTWKTNGDVNISHETTTTVVWIYDGI